MDGRYSAPRMVKRHHLIMAIHHTPFTGGAAPPVKYTSTIKIAFITPVMTAKNDVFQIVKRIVASDLFCCHDLRAGTKTGLKLLLALQLFGKAIALCQIHITKTIKGNIRGRRVFHMLLEISHHFDSKLRNLNIQRIGILLAHAAMGMACRTKTISWVALYHQNAPIKFWMMRQEPRRRRPHHRPANDHNIKHVSLV